jgi:hypothetical protein
MLTKFLHQHREMSGLGARASTAAWETEEGEYGIASTAAWETEEGALPSSRAINNATMQQCNNASLHLNPLACRTIFSADYLEPRPVYFFEDNNLKAKQVRMRFPGIRVDY